MSLNNKLMNNFFIALISKEKKNQRFKYLNIKKKYKRTDQMMYLN